MRNKKMPKDIINDEFYSENETHYKSLTSYFKHLVWITGSLFGIIIIITAVLLYQDRSDMKDDLKEVKISATKAIENTMNSADNSINQIRISAEKIAIDEAKLRIEEAFEVHNVKSLVDSAAKDIVLRSVQNLLKNEINKSLNKFESDLKEYSKIFDSAIKMRIGLRTGLTDLKELKNSMANEYLRNSAEDIYDDICSDYDRIHAEGFNKQYPKTINPGDIKEVYFGFKSITADIPNLIKIIQTENELNTVAVAFLTLKRKTGIQFRMFDIQNVQIWWDKNKNNYIEEN